tara:strand:- start:174 stop:494 length:321 start_codon:yes stop_codon:yes gene_type:complete
MNTLTPLIVRARGSKAGRFWAPINRLLIRGDVESSASNQAEVTVTTLIEAIQLDQLKSLIELFTGPPLAQLMMKPPAKTIIATQDLHRCFRFFEPAERRLQHQALK